MSMHRPGRHSGGRCCEGRSPQFHHHRPAYHRHDITGAAIFAPGTQMLLVGRWIIHHRSPPDTRGARLETTRFHLLRSAQATSST